MVEETHRSDDEGLFVAEAMVGRQGGEERGRKGRKRGRGKRGEANPFLNM